MDYVPQYMLEDCRIFHFGSVSLTDEPNRTATLHAAKVAKESGAIISYDSNYRPPLWKREQEAIQIMQRGVELADIVKVSEEEMVLLAGEINLAKGAGALTKAGVSLVVVTRGKNGAFYYTQFCQGNWPAYKVPVVDTIGSGDAFLGARLYWLIGMQKNDIQSLTQDTLDNIVKYCNAAGSLTTMTKGAIPAIPCHQQILQCLKDYSSEEIQLL